MHQFSCAGIAFDDATTTEEQPNRLFVWAAVGVWSHDVLPKLGCRRSRIRRCHTQVMTLTERKFFDLYLTSF